KGPATRTPSRVPALRMLTATWAISTEPLPQEFHTEVWGGLRLQVILNRCFSSSDGIDCVVWPSSLRKLHIGNDFDNPIAGV
ncbi:unnamed protein product, partial [Laminaria digitata]